MGCILDFISDGIGELMCLVIPEKIADGKLGCFLEILINVINVILFLSILLGIILRLNEDVYINNLGTKMISFPIVVYVIFIAIAIIMRKKK